MALADFLFRPGDIVYQWGSGWNGPVYIEACYWRNGKRVYDAFTGIWSGQDWSWGGMKYSGFPAENYERRCTWMARAGLLGQPQSPIRPWWEFDPFGNYVGPT